MFNGIVYNQGLIKDIKVQNMFVEVRLLKLLLIYPLKRQM